MGVILLVTASLVALVPAAAALIGNVGVAPQQGLLFGVCELTLAGICAALVYQNRYTLWMMPSARLIRLLVQAGAFAAGCLIAYLFLYNLLVIEHPLYQSKLLFPLWPTGKLAAMIEAASSRYGAVEMYGLAAVFDAISEAPAGYALALGTLLVLYAPPIAAVCGIAFALALRYPSPLFRAPSTNDSEFDVFLSYNRADQLSVRAIADKLAAQHVRFFLDEHENAPGEAWTDQVTAALSTVPAFAIFLGGAGVGKWQAVEIQNIAEARLERDCRVIPVFLPDAPASLKLPMQLAGLTWVDFRKSDPDPMIELIRGIRVGARAA